MTLSVIINTIANAPGERLSWQDGPAYRYRAYALRNFIIPRYVNDPLVDEVLVSGTWEPGPGYTYLEVREQLGDVRDVLLQRQAGLETATGSLLVFQNDDHVFDTSLRHIPELLEHASIAIPSRWTRLRNGVPEPLNNGHDEGYISFHGTAYQRDVLTRHPWRDVPMTHPIDLHHTDTMVGETVIRSSDLVIWDVEYGSTPWE